MIYTNNLFIMDYEYVISVVMIILGIAFAAYLIYIIAMSVNEGLIDQPVSMLPFLKPEPVYDYTYYPMKDSPGNNIRQDVFKKGNTEALKKACNARTDCMGFNTDAWMKYRILPQEQWKAWGTNPGKGLYVKS